MREIIETVGNHRVSLLADDSPSAPDHDGQGYVIRANLHCGRALTVHADSSDAEPDFDLNHLARRYGNDYQMVERYLRIFHDVVSFDYTSWDRDMMFFVVTRQQAEAWGCLLEDWHKLAGQAEEVWAYYGAGETYGYVVETLETWTRNSDGFEMESWAEVDSCWGLYGWDDAESQARDALKWRVEQVAAA
jgi:hypothetical protein